MRGLRTSWPATVQKVLSHCVACTQDADPAAPLLVHSLHMASDARAKRSALSCEEAGNARDGGVRPIPPGTVKAVKGMDSRCAPSRIAPCSTRLVMVLRYDETHASWSDRTRRLSSTMQTKRINTARREVSCLKSSRNSLRSTKTAGRESRAKCGLGLDSRARNTRGQANFTERSH